MPENIVLNFLKLEGCAPCKVIEQRLGEVPVGMKVRKIEAKYHDGTENYILISEDGERKEVHQSSIPAFPALWLAYPNGKIGKVLVGVDGFDAILRGEGW